MVELSRLIELIKKLMSENDFLSINKYIEQILYK